MSIESDESTPDNQPTTGADEVPVDSRPPFVEARIAQLLHELDAKDRQIAELKTELHQFRAGKTWPPPSIVPGQCGTEEGCEGESTEDLKCQKERAEMIKAFESLTVQVTTMNSELAQVHMQLAEYAPIMRRATDFLQAGCCDHCPHKGPRLSVVPTAGE